MGWGRGGIGAKSRRGRGIRENIIESGKPVVEKSAALKLSGKDKAEV